jgi:transcriptional regulator with XRE-family HTH domain
VVEKMRKIREKQGLSQQELADRAGVVKSTIYEAEVGRRIPRIQTLEKLADALGVEIVDLLPSRKESADA